MGGRLILIADADARFCAFVTSLVERAGFSATTACTGHGAVEAAREERPGLVVLDVGLPGLSGFEVCQQLRDEFGDELPIVFVSADRTQPLDRAAGLLLGGDDYLAKPVDGNELLARFRRLLARARGGRGPQRRETLDVPLTRRELEILELLAAGLASKEIAARLVISPKTVASHVQHVLAKLGVHTRAEAVALVYREGVASASEASGRAAENVRAPLGAFAA